MAIRLERRGRNWAVYDGETLVCLTVYKKGATEVVRRLTAIRAHNPQRTTKEEAHVERSTHLGSSTASPTAVCIDRGSPDR
jgi:hypothetical protein